MCFEGRLDPDAASVRRRDRKRAAARAKYAADPEKFRALSKKWALENPERLKVTRSKARSKWRRANPGLHREARRKASHTAPSRRRMRVGRRKHAYGITREQYDDLLFSCSGRCVVCRCDPGNGVGRGLSVDHDHVTGAVRGLLCPACNLALGWARDSVERLDELKAYLLRHKER